MKKLVSILVIFVVLCGVFAACSREENDKITIWAGSYWGGDNEALLQEMVDNYNIYAEANGKPLANKVIIQQDMTATLTTSMISGRISDIILWDRFETVRYSHQNLFTPLDDYIASSGHSVDEFNQAAMSEFLYKGKHYGLPLDLDAWGYFVNRGEYLKWAKSEAAASEAEWLINAGKTDESTVGQSESKYNYPETWDQFYAAVKGTTIKDNNGNITRAGISSEVQFNAWVATAGGKVVDLEQNKIMYSSKDKIDDGSKTYRQATEEVLRFWDKMLLQDTDTPQEAEQAVTSFSYFSNIGNVDPFLSGKVAFKMNSLLNGVATYNKFKRDDFHYDFIGYPSGPDQSGVNPGKYNGGMMGGYGFVIPANAKMKDAAWSMMEWWIMNDSNYFEWTKLSNLIPSRKSVQSAVLESEELIQKAPYMSKIIRDIDNTIVRPPLINYSIFEGSILEPNKDGYLRRNSDTGVQKPSIDDFRNHFFRIMDNSSDLSLFD